MRSPAHPRGDTSSLHQLQQAFASQLQTHLEDTADASNRDFLRPSPRDQHIRFDVYHHAYRARLEEALKTHYPALHAVLGDERFHTLAMAYLAAHPSQRPSIRWFGDELATWMQAHADADSPGSLDLHPSLVDLARFEWALSSAFDAPDESALSFETLTHAPADEWVHWPLRLSASVHLLTLDWAIGPVWHAARNETPSDTQNETLCSETLPAAEGPPDPLQHSVLIWRQGLQVQWRSVAPDEAAALAASTEGASFASLCELGVASEKCDMAAAWAASLLRRWVDDEMLCPHH